MPCAVGLGYTDAPAGINPTTDLKGEIAMADAPAGTPAPRQALPLFVKQIEVLSAQRHARLAVKAQGTYAFAARANSVPINALEFGLAAHNYPIVFSNDERGLPVAVLGLQAGENVFIDEAGRWERGQYVPAYVRRYPFVALAPKDSTEYALCIDVASDLLEQGGARPLFEDGQPSELTKKALEFCQTYQTQQEATRQFVAAATKHSLLVPRSAKVTLRSGTARALSGFRIIDERKFSALGDNVFLDWRRRGWISLVYAHLASQACWPALVERASRREVVI